MVLGAEPSPAYFNILMWGESEEILDGTQLAADWTFSGLQKFGQGLLDRLRGLKLNHPLLQKVTLNFKNYNSTQYHSNQSILYLFLKLILTAQLLTEQIFSVDFRSFCEQVNIVEIPGILEIRKQVERLFPFNDACQWFIDRADIIFLVYDPSKLDVGPETEAILDQLKGREMQVSI